MDNSFTSMPPEDLRRLQLIQLEMLLEVDRVCKRNNIQYCIIAGTTLGAVRHGGYIPWDDDADVAMLRPEYERFVEACSRDLDQSKFYFQNHENTPGYRWGYGKVRRIGTEFVRKGQEHMPYPTGVFIDIFPMDNVPDNAILRRIHNVACTAIRKTLWSSVGARSDKSAWMRGVYRVLSWVPRNFVFRIHDRLRWLCNRKQTLMVRKLMFPTPNNGYYGYYRKWYEELTDIEFEGHLFPAAKDYDEYLTFKFGDYLVPPPLEQRRGHPSTKYKLLPIEENPVTSEAAASIED